MLCSFRGDYVKLTMPQNWELPRHRLELYRLLSSHMCCLRRRCPPTRGLAQSEVRLQEPASGLTSCHGTFGLVPSAVTAGFEALGWIGPLGSGRAEGPERAAIGAIGPSINMSPCALCCRLVAPSSINGINGSMTAPHGATIVVWHEVSQLQQLRYGHFPVFTPVLSS